MPLNLPSHAHGEGYSDMNILIPEFVQRENFEKGPYYANVGNFGAAGSTHLGFFKTLPENFPRWKAACMAMGGPFSAYRKSLDRTVCSMAERYITITAHDRRMRIITTNTTAS